MDPSCRVLDVRLAGVMEKNDRGGGKMLVERSDGGLHRGQFFREKLVRTLAKAVDDDLAGVLAGRKIETGGFFRQPVIVGVRQAKGHRPGNGS